MKFKALRGTLENKMELYESLKTFKNDDTVSVEDMIEIVSLCDEDIHSSIDAIVNHFCIKNKNIKLTDFCESFSGDDGYLYNTLFLDKMPVELLSVIYSFVVLHRQNVAVEKLYRNK